MCWRPLCVYQYKLHKLINRCYFRKGCFIFFAVCFWDLLYLLVYISLNCSLFSFSICSYTISNSLCNWPSRAHMWKLPSLPVVVNSTIVFPCQQHHLVPRDIKICFHGWTATVFICNDLLAIWAFFCLYWAHNIYYYSLCSWMMDELLLWNIVYSFVYV